MVKNLWECTITHDVSSNVVGSGRYKAVQVQDRSEGYIQHWEKRGNWKWTCRPIKMSAPLTYQGVEVESMTQYHIWHVSYEVVWHVSNKVVRHMSNVSDEFIRHVSNNFLRSRPINLTCVLQLRKTRVLQLRKARVKYDTMSDFPLLPLGTHNCSVHCRIYAVYI